MAQAVREKTVEPGGTRETGAPAALEGLGAIADPHGLVDEIDPVGMLRALGRAAASVARHPVRASSAYGNFVGEVLSGWSTAAEGPLSGPRSGARSPGTGDRRFADASWSSNGFYDGL